MQEVWKDIENYEGLYQVSNLGRVKSLVRNIILKEIIFATGYSIVSLYNKSGTKQKSIHRLVASAFLEKPKNKNYVNHKDGNKSNNRLDNLEWVTSGENQVHSYTLGLSKGRKGETHHNNKLTETQVKEIKSLKDKLFQQQIADKFNISRSQVGRILSGEQWSHV